MWEMELYLLRLNAGDKSREGGEQWIRFPRSPDFEIGLGRASDQHVRLLSPHVSRIHAVIKKSGDENYYIKDLNSLNGIHVNETKVEKEVWTRLREGYKVEIGRPMEGEILESMDMNDRFIYVVKGMLSEELNNKSPGPKNHMSATVQKMVSSTAKEKKFGKHKLGSSQNKKTKQIPVEVKETVLRIKMNDVDDNKIRKEFSEVDESDSDKVMERENKRLKLELEEKDKALKREIDKRHEKLEEEQKKITAELEKNFKNKLEEKEEELEMRLQLEKDLALEQCKSTTVNDGKPSSTIESVVDTMENELQCSICSELFIVATTLNCAHTFCQFCITEWRRVKSICPVCRHEIETMTHSLVLDNYIDKALETLSSERKAIRTKLIKERKKLSEKQKKNQRQQTSSRGRRRGRGYIQGRSSRGQENNSIGVRTRSAVVIISDDDSSDTPSDSSSLSSSIESNSDIGDDLYGYTHYM